jgi:NAD(P)-dependent dehydrogenase (short-subunit alcohol dehydrogenase family)
MANEVSKAVLITGCSTGIGRASAQRLARNRRWTVYASARRVDAIADLASDGCRLLALDVTDEASMAEAVGHVEAAHGSVAGLVNNAGYGEYGPVEEVGMDQVRRQFETNVFGLVRMCQLVLPGMRRTGFGRIVNMGSVGGRLTFPGGGLYHATKHAVEALSDALRWEVRPFGIAVSLIEPGTIKSEFGGTVQGTLLDGVPPASPYAALTASVQAAVHGAYDGPMSRMAGSPDDVAKVVERALSRRRPRSRYPVTAGARLILGTRRLLPDRAWDTLLKTQFSPPTPTAVDG